MSFPPYFLVMVRHLLNPLCQSEQGVVSDLELATQTGRRQHHGELSESRGFSLCWGHWDQLMKPFPQVRVFFAFMNTHEVA